MSDRGQIEGQIDSRLVNPQGEMRSLGGDWRMG